MKWLFYLFGLYSLTNREHWYRNPTVINELVFFWEIWSVVKPKILTRSMRTLKILHWSSIDVKKWYWKWWELWDSNQYCSCPEAYVGRSNLICSGSNHYQMQRKLRVIGERASHRITMTRSMTIVEYDTNTLSKAFLFPYFFPFRSFFISFLFLLFFLS